MTRIARHQRRSSMHCATTTSCRSSGAHGTASDKCLRVSLVRLPKGHATHYNECLSQQRNRMVLSAGSRLGPYEILSAVGAGGMGEVYRARDTKLNRDVALKILPSEFALDADRLARFKREAQVLASLDHPNIGA